MLFSIGQRDRQFLSRRSRAFIRLHQTAVLGLIAWIAYLFVIREIL